MSDDAKPLPPGIVRSKSSLPQPLPRGGRGDQERVSGSPSPGTGEGLGRGQGASRITAIEAQEKRAGRVSVFVDGKFAIGLFEDVAASLGLRVGQAVTPERLEEMAQAETKRRAREDAYRLLSYRDRAEGEITDRLTRKGYEPEVVDDTLAHLRSVGFVNDEAFARSWADARGATRGRRALAFELKQKGVDAETATRALNERSASEGDQAAARTAAVRKVGERPTDRSPAARARLAAFLQRRGFDWEAIRPVLAELYSGTVEDDED